MSPNRATLIDTHGLIVECPLLSLTGSLSVSLPGSLHAREGIGNEFLPHLSWKAATEFLTGFRWESDERNPKICIHEQSGDPEVSGNPPEFMCYAAKRFDLGISTFRRRMRMKPSWYLCMVTFDEAFDSLSPFSIPVPYSRTLPVL